MVREEINESFVEGSIVDEIEDGVDGLDSFEVIFLDTSFLDNGVVIRILDEEGVLFVYEMEIGRQEGVIMAVELKKIQVSSCMFLLGVVVFFVSVDALINFSFVFVFVDNVIVQILFIVFIIVYNVGELSNVIGLILFGVIFIVFDFGDLSNKNIKIVFGDFIIDISVNVSSFDLVMVLEDIVNVSEMEDLFFIRMVSLLLKNEFF